MGGDANPSGFCSCGREDLPAHVDAGAGILANPDEVGQANFIKE